MSSFLQKGYDALPMTGDAIKTAYENQPDTNAYSDGEKGTVAEIAGWKGENEAMLARVTKERHPLRGSIVRAYAPGNVDPNIGALMFDTARGNLWRVWTESSAHKPVLGQLVYAEVSKGVSASFSGRRAIYAGRLDRKVLAICGNIVLGRLVVIVNTEDAAGNRYLEIVQSVDGGANWTVSAIGGLTPGINHFMYDKLHSFPSVAGGNDAQGLIFSTYTNGSTYVIWSDDAGATWQETLFFGPASPYKNLAGQVVTGFIATEMAMVQVGSEGKFVHILRGQDQAHFLALTSNDMRTPATAQETTIPNEGATLEVGTPPHFIADGDMIHLYWFGRYGWVDAYPEMSGAMAVYSQDGASLFDASGVFAQAAPTIVASLPGRATGMMTHCAVPGGHVAMVKAKERVFDASDNPASSEIYMLGTVQLAAPFVGSRPNLIDNPTFDLAQRGTSFTGLTGSTGHPVLERWVCWPSGDTVDVSQGDVDPIFSEVLPFRPKHKMVWSSTGNDYSGPRQAHLGAVMMRQMAGSEMTFSLYGIGDLVTGARVVVQFDYGAGGNNGAGQQTDAEQALFLRSASGPGRLTMTSATLITPSLQGKTLGTNPRVDIFIDSVSSEARNFEFVGVKAEFGPNATTLAAPDMDLEEIKALRFFERIGMEAAAIGSGSRLTSSSFQLTLGYSAKAVEAPTVALKGSTSNIRIRHISGNTAGSGAAATFEQQGRSKAFVTIPTAADTSYLAGEVWSTDPGTYFTVDARV
ncbi:hypothetical protein KBY28_07775 [Ruegeria pomeroyi]|uniref:hypothetical protein n=1 Tax=Ruegeria pomeroyi TaxID=89184 RepID=UPI001F25E9FD|nr:hypothetical protein [Ruegeria pomeroyi]MCE8508348.1 hypothetical protein [Ruegeria pomeroyi]